MSLDDKVESFLCWVHVFHFCATGFM